MTEGKVGLGIRQEQYITTNKFKTFFQRFSCFEDWGCGTGQQYIELNCLIMTIELVLVGANVMAQWVKNYY